MFETSMLRLLAVRCTGRDASTASLSNRPPMPENLDTVDDIYIYIYIYIHIYILHYLKDPKLWEFWYIPYYG